MNQRVPEENVAQAKFRLAFSTSIMTERFPKRAIGHQALRGANLVYHELAD
jgi:hypothetical protein